MSAAPSRRERAIQWLDGAAAQRGFLFKVALFPLLDYALPFLPNQMLLVALSFLQQARWLALALTFAVASALGAFAIAAIVQSVGGSFSNWLAGNVDGAGQVIAFIERHGLIGLMVLALLPWPPRTAVMLCALSGLAPVQIMLAVGFGRLAPAAAIAFLAAQSPAWLRRIPGVDRQFARLGIGAN